MITTNLGGDMTGTRSATRGAMVSSVNSKALIAGFALGAAGGLISLCGLGISGTALVAAIGRWIKAEQEPPSAIVKRKVAQASAAAAAGASAWQDQTASKTRTR
jgi:hypothetical protein